MHDDNGIYEMHIHIWTYTFADFIPPVYLYGMGQTNSVHINVLSGQYLNGITIDPGVRSMLQTKLADISVDSKLFDKAKKQMARHREKFAWADCDVTPASVYNVYSAAAAAVLSSKKLRSLSEPAQHACITALVAMIVQAAAAFLTPTQQRLLNLLAFNDPDSMTNLALHSPQSRQCAEYCRVSNNKKPTRNMFTMRQEISPFTLKEIDELVAVHPETRALQQHIRSVDEQEATLRTLETQVEAIVNERNTLKDENERLRQQVVDLSARAIGSPALINIDGVHVSSTPANAAMTETPASALPVVTTTVSSSGTAVAIGSRKSTIRRAMDHISRTGNVHGIQE